MSHLPWLLLIQPEPEVSEGEPEEAAEDTDKEPDAASDAAPRRPRPYVHLSCVHCKEKCATFAVSITTIG